MAATLSHPTAGISKGLPGSHSFIVLRSLLCLILSGCSAHDDSTGVPPPSKPTIEGRLSIIIISGSSAILTASVNPGGLETTCRIEFGPTTAYGTLSALRSIGSSTSNIVVADTIDGLGADTTYHCRLIAQNSAGRGESADTAFSLTSSRPAIKSQLSIVISKARAIMVATVNPGGLETTCHIEYGLTSAYGLQSASRSIGSSTSNIVVADTIDGLGADTTYHCRLIAQNSAGRGESADATFMLEVFRIPLTLGTRWRYSYTEWCGTPNYSTPGLIRGTQIWTVVARYLTDSVLIKVSRVDSIGAYQHIDSVRTSELTFVASINEKSYRLPWYDLILAPFASSAYRANYFEPYITVPRYVGAGVDSISIGYDIGSTVVTNARYRQGVGLVSFRRLADGHSAVNEILTLDSVTVAP